MTVERPVILGRRKLLQLVEEEEEEEEEKEASWKKPKWEDGDQV